MTASEALPALCFHCGLPLTTGNRFQRVVMDRPRNFCCPGCLAVADSIMESGLEDYYWDREDLPAKRPPEVTSRTDWNHPSIRQEFLQQENGIDSLELSLEDLHCAACVWLIEKKLQQEAGVKQAVVNLSTHRLSLAWDSEVTSLGHLLASLAAIGYRAHPYRPDTHTQQLQKENRQLLTRLAVAGFGMMQVMMYAGSLYTGHYHGIEAEYRRYLDWINLLLTTPVFFYAGWPFYRSAWRALRARRLNMDVPVTLALAGAYFASVYATLTGHGDSYYDSVTMFIFFLLTSHYLEARARQRSGDTAARLMAQLPRLATRMSADGRSQEVVAASELKPGERVLVKPGEILPADGRVLEGRSAVSEALLTGEPLPLEKNAGDTVLGGSLNSDGVLLLEVTHDSRAGILGTLNRLLDRALAEKPQLASRADQLAQVFVAVVLVLALLVFLAWGWQGDWSRAFWITLSVLVATCPCALSLATPMALGCATNALAAKGLLITRGHVLETLSAATHIVFDKTGTLTEGQVRLSAQQTLRGDAQQALRLAAALEQHSEHPLARAFQQLPLSDLPAVSKRHHEAGAGISGLIDGREYRIGHAAFALPQADDADNDRIWLADADGAIAAFTLEDSLRPEATEVLAALQQQGLKLWLLSGDRSAQLQTVAAQLPLDHVQGGLSPEEKRACVQQLQEQGAVVVMVGDGVNDAPVLAQAHVSVAMASATDLAQVTADSVLLRDDLRPIAAAQKMAGRTQRIIRQNLGWALAYNLAVLPPAALGWLPPWAAALGMSLSSLLVVGNALRLR